MGNNEPEGKNTPLKEETTKLVETSTVKETKIKENNGPKFFDSLLDYYNSSVGDLVNSIKKMANIQKTYPEEYELFKRLDKDPDLIVKLGKELSVEEKVIFFELLLKSSSLSERISIVTRLTYKEKMILIKDMEDFAKEFSKKLKESKEKK